MIKVISGDSFLFRTKSGEILTVYLSGVDVPDCSKIMGKIARNYLSKLIMVKYVSLRSIVEGQDSICAEVFLDDKWINDLICKKMSF